MKTALIIHGMPSRHEYLDPKEPSPSNHHWLPWIQKQLILKDYIAQAPEMPEAYAPRWRSWHREFERFELNRASLLIGHSCGAGFLLRCLSENSDLQIDKLALVAPWIDPERKSTEDFFEFKIDKNLANRCRKIILFNSDNDAAGIQESVRLIRTSIEAIEYREFHNYGHFCKSDLGGEEFPELLKELLD
ncbi:MAG: alpha/beta hydrolase [Candidatus Obscuribacterales bacterium]|nr:alpha/beta hydrolase [Candidatus Obscuribacterales bacterium]